MWFISSSIAFSSWGSSTTIGSGLPKAGQCLVNYSNNEFHHDQSYCRQVDLLKCCIDAAEEVIFYLMLKWIIVTHVHHCLHFSTCSLHAYYMKQPNFNAFYGFKKHPIALKKIWQLFYAHAKTLCSSSAIRSSTCATIACGVTQQSHVLG